MKSGRRKEIPIRVFGLPSNAKLGGCHVAFGEATNHHLMFFFGEKGGSVCLWGNSPLRKVASKGEQKENRTFCWVQPYKTHTAKQYFRRVFSSPPLPCRNLERPAQSLPPPPCCRQRLGRPLTLKASLKSGSATRLLTPNPFLLFIGRSEKLVWGSKRVGHESQKVKGSEKLVRGSKRARVCCYCAE